MFFSKKHPSRRMNRPPLFQKLRHVAERIYGMSPCNFFGVKFHQKSALMVSILLLEPVNVLENGRPLDQRLFCFGNPCGFSWAKKVQSSNHQPVWRWCLGSWETQRTDVPESCQLHNQADIHRERLGLRVNTIATSLEKHVTIYSYFHLHSLLVGRACKPM